MTDRAGYVQPMVKGIRQDSGFTCSISIAAGVVNGHFIGVNAFICSNLINYFSGKETTIEIVI